MGRARQYDLFGEQEAKDQAAAQAIREKVAWVARFERVPVPPPRLHPGDVPAPHRDTRVWLGWVCPACGQVEGNTFLLNNNHGYDPDQPGRSPYGAEFGATCWSLELQAAHKVYDRRRAEVSHLITAGLDDEQIAARIKWWDAKTIAYYRQDDAKAARRRERAARGEVVRVEHGSECPCAYCGGPCSCPSCQAFRGDTR